MIRVCPGSPVVSVRTYVPTSIPKKRLRSSSSSQQDGNGRSNESPPPHLRDSRQTQFSAMLKTISQTFFKNVYTSMSSINMRYFLLKKMGKSNILCCLSFSVDPTPREARTFKVRQSVSQSVLLLAWLKKVAVSSEQRSCSELDGRKRTWEQTYLQTAGPRIVRNGAIGKECLAPKPMDAGDKKG